MSQIFRLKCGLRCAKSDSGMPAICAIRWFERTDSVLLKMEVQYVKSSAAHLSRMFAQDPAVTWASAWAEILVRYRCTYIPETETTRQQHKHTSPGGARGKLLRQAPNRQGHKHLYE